MKAHTQPDYAVSSSQNLLLKPAAASKLSTVEENGNHQIVVNLFRSII